MTTLHVETQVRDFASWKTVFDSFDRFRIDHGVRSYRMSRDVEDPNQVTIDMLFDSAEAAVAFRRALLKIWSTPQSQRHLVSHGTPTVLEEVEVVETQPS